MTHICTHTLSLSTGPPGLRRQHGGLNAMHRHGLAHAPVPRRHHALLHRAAGVAHQAAHVHIGRLTARLWGGEPACGVRRGKVRDRSGNRTHVHPFPHIHILPAACAPTHTHNTHTRSTYIHTSVLTCACIRTCLGKR